MCPDESICLYSNFYGSRCKKGTKARKKSAALTTQWDLGPLWHCRLSRFSRDRKPPVRSAHTEDSAHTVTSSVFFNTDWCDCVTVADQKTHFRAKYIAPFFESVTPETTSRFSVGTESKKDPSQSHQYTHTWHRRDLQRGWPPL